MTGFERLVLLFGLKATVILGIVAGLYLLVGRRWPQSCTIWLRFGVIALWALPVGVWALPTIGIPILPPQYPAVGSDEAWLLRMLATPFPRTAGVETTIRQDLSARQRDKLPAAMSSLPAAGSAEP